jgi:hypothetical protein
VSERSNGALCAVEVVTWAIFIYFFWHWNPARTIASSSTRFVEHTQRRATVDRTPLNEWSALRKDRYLTKQNTHNRQTYMPWWNSNPRSQQVSGRRPTSYHWDRQHERYTCTKFFGRVFSTRAFSISNLGQEILLTNTFVDFLIRLRQNIK